MRKIASDRHSFICLRWFTSGIRSWMLGQGCRYLVHVFGFILMKGWLCFDNMWDEAGMFLIIYGVFWIHLVDTKFSCNGTFIIHANLERNYFENEEHRLLLETSRSKEYSIRTQLPFKVWTFSASIPQHTKKVNPLDCLALEKYPEHFLINRFRAFCLRLSVLQAGSKLFLSVWPTQRGRPCGILLFPLCFRL